MRPQMEKVYPAGVKKEGRASEISPAVRPLKGRILDSALTVTTATKAMTFAILSVLSGCVFVFIT